MKKVELEIPDEVPVQDAQQCLHLGVKAYFQTNNSGVCAIYGVQRDEDTAVKVVSFRGQYAAALMNFLQAIEYLSKNEEEKNLAILRDKGSEIIRGLESK